MSNEIIFELSLGLSIELGLDAGFFQSFSQSFDISKSMVLVGASIVCATTFLLFKLSETVHSALVFVWACFMKPMFSKLYGKPHEQQQALEMFYSSQAHVYDKTREVLLKGRVETLQIAMAHLQKKLDIVWVDIGGGTGSNIEFMDRISSISKSFKAVYLVDLSPSLCAVAKKRFADKSWNNVHVKVADACNFDVDEAGVDLVTFLYSLSMIPTFHCAIDHAHKLLNPHGIVACVDFGVQSADSSLGRVNTVGGVAHRNNSWLVRNFWKIWFEADRVYLEPTRRHYLEYRFGTLKSVNAYNNAMGRIPYYIWVGCDKSMSASLVNRINCLATESPYLAPSEDAPEGALSDSAPTNDLNVPISKGHEAALANFRKNLPYPSIYYQKEIWRVYYDDVQPQYDQFANQYIYAFTWEDPREDHNILNFGVDDTVLAITSAGDNILSYASLPTPPKRIHAVDLNPCQNHLLELKLAAFRKLNHSQIWSMFGEGKIDNFQHLLTSKLSPHMSSNAFQFWMDKGPRAFDVHGKGLYDTGSTRWALRLAKYTFKLFGVAKYVDQLCNCSTMEEQKEVWTKHLKPALFNPIVSAMLIGNPIFLWKALGVPLNQASMMQTSMLKYVVDTLEPVIDRSLVSKDNYFYYLTLAGKYSPVNCPDYLTAKGFRNLSSKDSGKEGSSPLDNIRIHTDSLNDVFGRLRNKSLTIAIIMDHMDWFDPKGDDAKTEITALKQCLAPGGRVMLRSASTHPWYIKTFEELGFKCLPAAVRNPDHAIDRINMYASTWVCTMSIDPPRRISNLKI